MNRTKILIIEDNPSDIAIIEAYLKEAGFKHQLFKADALSEGLNQLWEHKPDLVLLDLKLVDVEGFKTLQLFREKAPDVPVVVLTGFKNEIMGIQSVRAGAQDFLVKGDFDSRSLVRTIRYSLQRFEMTSKLQKRAEKLSRSEDKNRIIQHIARFGSWEMDIVSNEMKWDEEIFKFFGFPPNSFKPTLSEYFKYVHVSDRSRVEKFFENAINDGQPHSIIHRIVIDNTVVKHLKVNAQINYNEAVNHIALMGSIQDITDQEAAELPVEPTNAPDDSDNPPEESKDGPPSRSMFTDFTFNIRTPIASLINFIYLMKESPLNEQQTSYLTGMRSALDDLTFSLNNWINLSTLQGERIEHKPGEIHLTEIIRTIYKISSIRAEKTSAKLEMETSQKLPDFIYTDKEKVTQIIYNLIEVAINYCKPSSNINLHIGIRGSRKNNLTLLLKAKFSSSLFSVEEAEKLMGNEDVLHTREIESSLYLPLIIAQRLTVFLDGRLELMKPSAQKVSLSVELPVEASQREQEETPSRPEENVKILLVEDHDLHRLATQRLLTGWSEKVQVTTAENGQEGAELALGNKFDLILMDLQMPVLNGIEASLKIRKHSSTPIIALTANESKQEQERCRMIGINDYLVKPIKPEKLYKRIMQQLRPPSPQ